MTARQVPDWLLERLAAGDLPPEQAQALQAELAAAGEAHRLEALRGDEDLRRYPPEVVAAEVRRRAARQAPPARRWRPVWLGAAVAAVAVLLLVARPSRTIHQAEEHIIVKGEDLPSLRLYQKTAVTPRRLRPGDRVRGGDVLQAAYLAAGKRFGVIASIDADGEVSLHLPEQPGRAAPLVAGGERALPHSFVLDAKPGFERFLFAAADEPFATEDVARALGRGAALPRSVVTVELTLVKEGP